MVAEIALSFLLCRDGEVLRTDFKRAGCAPDLMRLQPGCSSESVWSRLDHGEAQGGTRVARRVVGGDEAARQGMQVTEECTG